MCSNHDDEDRQEAARQHPEETVDALEHRVTGRTDSRNDQDRQDPTPATEQNLDSDDLGSAAAGTEPSD